MPVDTNREAWRSHGLDAAPPVCSCLIAFRNSRDVRALWHGAAARLLEEHPSHPYVHAPPTPERNIHWGVHLPTIALARSSASSTYPPASSLPHPPSRSCLLMQGHASRRPGEDLSRVDEQPDEPEGARAARGVLLPARLSKCSRCPSACAMGHKRLAGG